MAKVAEILGTPLMPWQRLVADVGLELDPETGLPAYREVWFSVMRQSGKTTEVLAFEVERCVSWDDPQKVAYTAQTGWDARKKLLEDQVPILQSSALFGLVERVQRAQGNEGVVWKSGSRMDVLASTVSAGHGRTLDLGVIDEPWKDEDDRREQAILPAMVTRPAAQLLGCSTMGTDASTYLNRKVDTGRDATIEDSGRGVAYFEWSIPDDADIDDPEVWWAYMPALGWTITEDVVRHARQTMSDGEFRRAFGNQRTSADERPIPVEVWDAAQDWTAEPRGEPQWGLDVIRGMGHADAAAIAASDGVRVALIDHREGIGWAVERMAELHNRRGGYVVIDSGGPAAPIADDLEAVGVPVQRRKWGDVAAACGRVHDALVDRRIRVYPHPDLDTAVAGATKKPVGDRFVWSRAQSTADVTPLMAATLAYSRQEEQVQPFVDFA